MPDTLGYKYTFRIFNNYWFFTATVVAGTRLNIRLFVYYLSYMKYSLFIEMCLKIWKVVVDVVELGAVLSYFTNPLY